MFHIKHLTVMFITIPFPLLIWHLKAINEGKIKGRYLNIKMTINMLMREIIHLPQQDGTVVQAFALRLLVSKLTYCNCEWLASRDLWDKSNYTSTIFNIFWYRARYIISVVKLYSTMKCPFRKITNPNIIFISMYKDISSIRIPTIEH